MSSALRIPDGTLLRETSRPEVYVIYGQARFCIPTPEEFEALGFDWEKVEVVGDGTATNLPMVSITGTLPRDRS